MSNIAIQVDQQRAAGFLGASEAAAALGLDPYTSPLTIAQRIRGEETDDERPAFVQEAADWGQALEPIIRGKYALRTGSRVYVPTKSLEFGGWLRATPDGVVDPSPGADGVGVEEFPDGYSLGDFAQGCGLVQIKTASAYKREEWANGVPTAYEIQVRVEMAVANLPWCDVVCLIGGQKMVDYRIERDGTLEDNLIRDLRQFWEDAKAGKDPNPDHTAAWRKLVSERMAKANKVAIQPDKHMLELVNALRSIKQSIERDERNAESLKTEILLHLSAAGATQIDLGEQGRVTAYKTGGRTDWKGYAMSLGGAAKPPWQWTKESSTWALRLPGAEE